MPRISCHVISNWFIYIYTYHIIYIYDIWYSCENVKMLRSAWPEPLKDGGNKVTWAKAANCANCMAPVAWAPWAAESDAKLPRKMRYVINEPLPYRKSIRSLDTVSIIWPGNWIKTMVKHGKARPFLISWSSFQSDLCSVSLLSYNTYYIISYVFLKCCPL